MQKRVCARCRPGGQETRKSRTVGTERSRLGSGVLMLRYHVARAVALPPAPPSAQTAPTGAAPADTASNCATWINGESGSGCKNFKQLPDAALVTPPTAPAGGSTVNTI